ncbi:hypothetical protein LPJ66_008219, partial [Kickxella alabastrina]
IPKFPNSRIPEFPMLSADDPSLITSYELVARSLEDSIKYDNLSDADKSRARKQPLHMRQPGRRGGLKQRCLAGLRSIDLFWALTAASIGTFILIALALLYFRHSHNAFMRRFSHEELSRRRHHLGFGHIYAVQHADGGVRWAEDAARMEIELQPWPVAGSAPTATDARTTLLVQHACWLAHRGIYRDIVSSGHMDALIIEDRAVAGPSARLRLYGALRGVPADWDHRRGPPRRHCHFRRRRRHPGLSPRGRWRLRQPGVRCVAGRRAQGAQDAQDGRGPRRL